MYKSLPFILLSLAVLLLQSCGSASKYSNQKKEVKVAMGVKEDPGLLHAMLLEPQVPLDFSQKTELAMAPKSRGIITAGIVGQAASLAITGTKQLIAKEKKKYIAEHNQNVSQIYFYDQISAVGPFDPTGMQFRGFEFLRLVEVDNRIDTALWFEFEVDMDNPYSIINNSMFYLRLKDAKIKFAKAKVPKTRWYNPFSWGSKKDDDKLNLDIDIAFKATFLTKGGAIVEDLEIGSFFLPIRNFPIDQNDTNYTAKQNALKHTMLHGYSFLVPRSFGYRVGTDSKLHESYSQGLFSIAISVTESGKEKFITKVAQDNSEVLIKQAEKLIISNLMGK